MNQIRLDMNSGVPFYRQIVDQIRSGIASGTLAPGEQLPTVRELAVELSVNPNTIRKAYSELDLRGVIDSQQGTGTFVGKEPIKILPAERRRKLKQICEEFVARAQPFGIGPKDLIASLKKMNRPS